MKLHVQRRGGGAGSVVLVALALAIVAGGLWYFLLRPTPERTVTQMLEALQANDHEAMRSNLTSRSDTSGSLVIALSQRLAGDLSDEPRFSVAEAQIDGDRATVPVTFKLGRTISAVIRRDSFTVPYVLHREGINWLVDEPDTATAIGEEITGGARELLERFFAF